MSSRGRSWQFALLASTFIPFCLGAVRVQVNCRVRERHTQDGCPPLRHPFNCKGVPQTSLSSGNSLEGLTELTGNLDNHSDGLFQGKENKIRKSFRKKSGRRPNMELPGILSLWAHHGIARSRPWCVTICVGSYHPGKPTQASASRGSSGFYHTLPVLIPLPLPQASIINHNIKLSSGQSPRANRANPTKQSIPRA